MLLDVLHFWIYIFYRNIFYTFFYSLKSNIGYKLWLWLLVKKCVVQMQLLMRLNRMQKKFTKLVYMINFSFDWLKSKEICQFFRKCIENKLQFQEMIHIIKFILICKTPYNHLGYQYFYFYLYIFSFSGMWLLDIWLYEKLRRIVLILKHQL